MRISPDVERLMWMVAESADPKAVADFESRFPELRYELSKRIDMVRKLKASGKTARPQGSIPRFLPPSKAPGTSRLKWTVAAVALSALAFGSFYGTRLLVAPPPRQEPDVVYTPTLPTPREEPAPVENKGPDPVLEAPPGGLHAPDDEPDPTPKWQLPNDVTFDRIGLATAIKAIAAQCGLSIEMPADMPDEEVVVRYQGMTGMQMLEDMAQQFGFTAFDQGDGKVLIIPARDEDSTGGSNGEARNPETPRRLGSISSAG